MPPLVRVPEEIAGTVFPVYVEAAEGAEDLAADDRVQEAEHVEERGADLTDTDIANLPH